MRSRLLASCLTVTLAVGIGVTSSVQAVSAASPATPPQMRVKSCMNGGYRTVQTSTGATFSSQRACIVYVVRGGTLFRPSLSLVALGPVPRGGTCGPVPNVFAPVIWCFAVMGSGFHANSSLTITQTDSPGGSSSFPFGTTGTSGTFPFEHFGPCPISPPIFAETITATDAQGLHATISAVITCT